MMNIKKDKTTKRIKIILEEGKEDIVSYGGGLLIDEFIHRLGLPELIDALVKVKDRERGFKESEAALGLAISMITGGVCLDDLFVLRDEEAFKNIWRHGDIPHPTTMGDFLRRFDLGHIRQLESVITRVFHKVYSAGERMKTITLDIDSTLETKYGLSLDRFPCQEFHANWAYLTIGMLAYNIVNWLKRLALPSMYKKKLLKALRRRFFNVAARIVKHGRYVTLRLAQGIHRFRDILYAYQQILNLQFHCLPSQ